MKNKASGIISLVLGIVSLCTLIVKIFIYNHIGLLYISGFAGILALVYGINVFANKLEDKAFAVLGIISGSITCFILTVALLMEFFSHQPFLTEHKRQTAVKNNMHIIQIVLEAYALDHIGQYPREFEELFYYLPGGDPIYEISGELPINPYTEERYEYGNDIFYFPTKLKYRGQNAKIEHADPECPYKSLSAPEGVPGTIVILGYSESDNEGPSEYGIIGFGKNVTVPIYEKCKDIESRVYFVLHN